MNSIFRTSSTTIAIFIAIAIAVIIYIVLNKTTFGYELKACGFNKDAAKYAGINEKRNVVLSMTIAGALAGIGAGLYFLSGASEWNLQVSTALPAIVDLMVSRLRFLHLATRSALSSLLAAHMLVGGAYLPTKYYQPEIADLIVAVIIYLRIRYLVQGHRCKPVQEQKRAESKCQCRQRKGGEEIMFLF